MSVVSSRWVGTEVAPGTAVVTGRAHVRPAHDTEGGLAAGTAKLAGDARPTGTDDGRLGTGTERIATATAADEVVAISDSSETDA
ncbi:hypothetical protein [Streptomyces sp. NPDC029004]|uniref:hypothetical protein n=1 Tax=Streptomyces sp. NPDC029004 TaxID=3154490 RepID=UPI0033DE5BDA